MHTAVSALLLQRCRDYALLVRLHRPIGILLLPLIALFLAPAVLH